MTVGVGLVGWSSLFCLYAARIDQLSEENRGLKVLLQEPVLVEKTLLETNSYSLLPQKNRMNLEKEIPALESIIF